MINLYIDFDGVIMDTIEKSYCMFEKLGFDSKDFDRVVEFYKNLDWKVFLNQTEEINDSFKNIDRIVESDLFNVNILTHVTTLEEAEAKINFIRKRLHEITIITVPKKIDKTKIVNAKGAILIDDYASNLKKWEEAGGTGVRFSTKLHGKGFSVIDHLDQIINIVDEKEGIC